MTVALFPLEEFALANDGPSAIHSTRPSASPLSHSELEDVKSASYEAGFAAGWDDSAKSQSDLQTHVSAELAKNLQDLEFTFHEVRVQVMKSLEPLFQELVSKFLPTIANDSAAGLAVEKLLSVAESAIAEPLVLAVSPLNRLSVEAILASVQAPPTSILEDPALGGGQVILRAGPLDTHIDLDAAISEIQKSIQGFFGAVTQESKYG